MAFEHNCAARLREADLAHATLCLPALRQHHHAASLHQAAWHPVLIVGQTG